MKYGCKISKEYVYISKLGRNLSKIWLVFLADFKTLKFHSEINWPLKPSLTIQMLNAYKLFFFFIHFFESFLPEEEITSDAQRHFAFITKGSYSYRVQSWIFFRKVNTPLKLSKVKSLGRWTLLQQSGCKNKFSASRNRSQVS